MANVCKELDLGVQMDMLESSIIDSDSAAADDC